MLRELLVVVTNEAAGGTADDARSTAALAVLRDGGRRTPGGRAPSRATWTGVLDGLGDGGRLVVVGGDGSVHTAVAALRSLGASSRRTGRSAWCRWAPATTWPARSASRWTRRTAARALLAGRPRRLDLVVDDAGGVVVNAVHLGVGAEAAEKATRAQGPARRGGVRRRQRRGGRRRDRLVACGSWSTARCVHVDGEVLMVGGGQRPHHRRRCRRWRRRRRRTTGWLDVVVATSTGPLARLGFARRAARGRARRARRRARGARPDGDGDAASPFPLNADGELDGPVSSRTWTVEPGRLVLARPALHPAADRLGRPPRATRCGVDRFRHRVRSICSLRAKSSSRWPSRVAARSRSSAISTTSSSWSSERRLKFDEPTTAATPSTVITLACIIDGWKVQTRTPQSTSRAYDASLASWQTRLSACGPGSSRSTSTPRAGAAHRVSRKSSSGAK